MASGEMIDAGMLDYCIQDARAAVRKPSGSAMMFQEAIAFLADENDRLRAERDESIVLAERAARFLAQADCMLRTEGAVGKGYMPLVNEINQFAAKLRTP